MQYMTNSAIINEMGIRMEDEGKWKEGEEEIFHCLSSFCCFGPEK